MKRDMSNLLGLTTGIAAGALVGLPTYQAGWGATLGAIVGLATGAKWKRLPEAVSGAAAGTVLGWLAAKTIYGLASVGIRLDWPSAIEIVVGLFGLAAPLFGLTLGIVAALELPNIVDGRGLRAFGTTVASGLVLVVALMLSPQTYADACSEEKQEQYFDAVSTDGVLVFIEQLPDVAEREKGDRELARGESYSFGDGLTSTTYKVMAVDSSGAQVLLTRGAELASSRCLARISTEPGPAQQLGDPPAASPGAIASPTGGLTHVLFVRGRVFANPLRSTEPVTVRAELEFAFVNPNQPVPDRPTRGEYQIVLRDGAGQELSRTPFYAPGVYPLEDPFPAFEERLVFIPGTARIEIERAGVVLADLQPGEAAPTVSVTSPNGGEVLTDLPVRVEWQANDPDGDELSFIVEYSPDGGGTWNRLTSSPVKGNHLEIPILNTPDMVTSRGLFRVWASDGINTAQDQSDDAFSIPDPLPLAAIDTTIMPEVITLEQTLNLRAGYLVRLSQNAYGSVEDDQIEWSSDLDGFLGNGSDLAVLLRQTGRHAITLGVTDPAGNSASDTAVVEVVASGSDLPPAPDLLLVAPNSLTLAPGLGKATDTLSIDNANFGTPISWVASVSDAWIQLSHSSGMTFDRITVSYDRSLPPGLYLGTITIEQASLPEDRVIVPVSIDLSE